MRPHAWGQARRPALHKGDDRGAYPSTARSVAIRLRISRIGVDEVPLVTPSTARTENSALHSTPLTARTGLIILLLLLLGVIHI